MLGPQASPVYFVLLIQLETSRDLFEKVIQLSSLGVGKTLQWISMVGGARVVDWTEEGLKTLPDLHSKCPVL